MATESPTCRIEKRLTISVEADAFLQRVQEQRQVGSESEALEVLIRELIAVEKLRSIDAAYTELYDSLSAEDIAEDRAWGAFAESQLDEANGLEEAR